jgi:branched-chain amino acid transport system ATP-binding protein
MKIILECKKLTKYFGGLAAVDNINLQVDKGAILGIIGPNGAGKTTLFHLITGFEKVSSGTVEFKGEDITNLKPFKIANMGIARTFQIVRPFHMMTVFDNAVVSCLSKRATKLSAPSKSLQDRAWEILELVGLGDSANMMRIANVLPHGDLKRLEIARAIASKPEVLLLDEPFSGLSSGEIAEMQSLILKLHKEGYTIVIIEHILRALMQIVKNVFVMDFGKKIAEGTPQQIAKDKKVKEAYLGKRADILA